MGGIRSKALAGLCCLALVGGCVPEPPDAVERLAELKRQHAELDAATEALEERLLGNQANLHLWQELARRHRNVSEIATVNSSQHLAAMVQMLDKQQEKARKLKRKRSRDRKYLSGAVAANRTRGSASN